MLEFRGINQIFGPRLDRVYSEVHAWATDDAYANGSMNEVRYLEESGFQVGHGTWMQCTRQAITLTVTRFTVVIKHA